MSNPVFPTLVLAKGGLDSQSYSVTLEDVSMKSEMDGGKVWEYYKEGRIEEIRSYCAGDIVSTRMCHRKMMFFGVMK